MIQISRTQVRLATIGSQILDVLHGRNVKFPFRREGSREILENASERKLRLKMVPLDLTLETGLIRQPLSLVNT